MSDVRSNYIKRRIMERLDAIGEDELEDLRNKFGIEDPGLIPEPSRTASEYSRATMSTQKTAISILEK